MHDFKISPRSHIENPPALRTSRLLVGKRSAWNTYGTAGLSPAHSRTAWLKFRVIEPSVHKMVSFSQSTHSWGSTVFVGFFRRIHDGKPLRLRPRPSASILNVKQNLPHFQKSGSVLAPHLELNELDARVTPCELHARYRLHRNKYLHGNMRWKTLAENYTMLSFAPFFHFKIFVRNC